MVWGEGLTEEKQLSRKGGKEDVLRTTDAPIVLLFPFILTI